jgi:hypothetical protein
MNDELERRTTRMRQAIRLQRPDRMPFSGDWGIIEYRKDVYHLGEPELVPEIGQVVLSKDGKRSYTRNGGVWAVGDGERYKDEKDVLSLDPEQFAVEQVGPAMLDEMRRLYAERARTCFPLPWHYGTLVTRAVLEFGWEPFLVAAAVDPRRLGVLLDRFGAASLAVARGWTEVEGVELIVIHDDIAGTRGVFMQPEWYRRYVFPWYRRIFETIHEGGKKALYISDGNYLPVLDDLLETGTDGLYIESTSMEPKVVMQRAGATKLYMLKSDSRNVDLGTAQEIWTELEKLRALHADYPGLMLYRGGGNPRPGNAEAFVRAYNKLLVYT